MTLNCMEEIKTEHQSRKCKKVFTSFFKYTYTLKNLQFQYLTF